MVRSRVKKPRASEDMFRFSSAEKTLWLWAGTLNDVSLPTGAQRAWLSAEGCVNLLRLKADGKEFFDKIAFRHHVAVVEKVLGDEADYRQDPFSQAVSVVLLAVQCARQPRI